MTYPYVKNDYRNVQLSQSNVDFMRSGQHDSSSRSDLVVSKQSCSSSSLSGDSNAAVVASTSSDFATNNSENRQRRISVGSSDAIDLSKPRRFGDVNNETKDKFSNSDSKLIATTSPYAGTASLLNSLMMLSEKVRPSSPLASLDLNYPSSTICDEQHKSTMSIYQTYLTERALQKSKMRLSQVAPQHPQSIFDDSRASVKNLNGNRDTFSPFELDKKVGNTPCPSDGMIIIRKKDRDKKLNIEHKVVESTASNDIVKDTSCVDETRAEEDALHAQATVRTERNCVKFEMQIQKSVIDFGSIPLNKSINDHSSMDTLAEIAANSIKLDASKVTAGDTVVIARCEPQRSMATISYNVVSPQKTISKPSTSVQNETTATQKEISAKNIASEFLKIANEQDINYPISNTTTTTTDFDFDSSSSNSDITNESSNKQARRPSSLVRRTSGSTAHAEILISARTVVVGEDGFTTKSSNSKDLPMVRLPRGGSSSTTSQAFIQEDNGKVKCELCQQQFSKRSSLLLHMNVHYMNPQNKLRCDLCSQSFASQSRLQKHLQSDSHRSKANVVEATGTSTSTANNPRPFKCVNGCDKSFRIQGHLAKHLRYCIIFRSFFEHLNFVICYSHIDLSSIKGQKHIFKHWKVWENCRRERMH